VDGYPPAAHMGSVVEVEDLDRGFEPEVDPIRAPRLGEQGLEEAATAEEDPMLEPSDHEH
jgi:hypothetical protein